MHFADIFKWAQQSGVLAEVEKRAAAEAAKAIQQALDKAVGHAPDMQGVIQAGATQMLQGVLTGLATRQKA